MKKKTIILFVVAMAIPILTLTGCSKSKVEGTVLQKVEQKGFEFAPNPELNPFDVAKYPPIFWVFVRTDSGKIETVALDDRAVWEALVDGQRWRAP